MLQLGSGVRATILLFTVAALCLPLTDASFFGYPRIHFNGLFKADVSTGNNEDVNYIIANYSDEIVNPSWNPNGTGEFSFVNCSVTAVVNEKGETITDPKKDAIIGLPIVSNPSMVPAKLVDLDSPHYDLSSTVYGMKFGVNWKPNSLQNSFLGEWVPATISRDFWRRQIKNKLSDQMVQPIATQGSTRLVNVVWRDIKNSPILKQLHNNGKRKTLSVSISLYLYTRPSQNVKFTYGNVSGTIGVADSEEPLNFVGDRVLLYNENFPGDSMALPGGNTNPCKGEPTWMSTAYFNINKTPKLVATVDFGNSIKIDPHGKLCDFGKLYLAIIVNPAPNYKNVQIIGEIDYLNPDWYKNTAGLNDFPLLYNHVEKSPFAVVWAGSDLIQHEYSNYLVCTSTPAQKDHNSSTCVHIVMEESRFNLRPMNHHVYRLEAGNEHNDTAVLKLRLRDYGKIPTTRDRLSVKLIPISDNPNTIWNETCLHVDANPTMVNEDGIAILILLRIQVLDGQERN